MHKSRQIEVIRDAFRELDRIGLQDGFYDVPERLFDMNVAAEKQHRHGHSGSPLSIKDAAKLFVVKHLLDGHKEPDRFSVADILAIRNEVLYAQAYAKRFHDELDAWAGKWAGQFEQVDYAELMKVAA